MTFELAGTSVELPMSKKEAVQTTLVQKTLLALFSVALVLVVIGAGELYCRWFTRINFLGISRGLFVAHAFGDSYGNRPDFRGEAFGAPVQIDHDGFRIDPSFREAPGGDAALILGDSVSFGVGVEASKTVAGLLQRANAARLRFYNSSVIGYGLQDYANVVRALIPSHPDIKYALLFYCLNDIYDTNAEAIVQEVNGEGAGPKTFSSLAAFVNSTNAFLRSRSKLYLFIKTALTDPAGRYFNQDYAQYARRSFDRDMDTPLRPLRDIAAELAASGVTLEVFVMPYEAQVRSKDKSLFLPQTLVDDFLRKNGIAYFDASADFIQSGVPAERLYLYGDPMHLSEEGNRLSFQFANAELGKMMKRAHAD